MEDKISAEAGSAGCGHHRCEASCGSDSGAPLCKGGGHQNVILAHGRASPSKLAPTCGSCQGRAAAAGWPALQAAGAVLLAAGGRQRRRRPAAPSPICTADGWKQLLKRCTTSAASCGALRKRGLGDSRALRERGSLGWLLRCPSCASSCTGEIGLAGNLISAASATHARRPAWGTT